MKKKNFDRKTVKGAEMFNEFLAPQESSIIFFFRFVMQSNDVNPFAREMKN